MIYLALCYPGVDKKYCQWIILLGKKDIFFKKNKNKVKMTTLQAFSTETNYFHDSVQYPNFKNLFSFPQPQVCSL